MDLDKYRKGLIAKARELYAGNDPRSDILRHLRILRLAERIAHFTPLAEKDVVIPAALFYNAAQHGRGYKMEALAPTIAFKNAEIALSIVGEVTPSIPDRKLNAIGQAILGLKQLEEEFAHDKKGRETVPLASKIVADARWLNKVSLVGIAEAFHDGALTEPARSFYHAEDPFGVHSGRAYEPGKYTLDLLARRFENARNFIFTDEGFVIFEHRRRPFEEFFANLKDNLPEKRSLGLDSKLLKIRGALIELARPLYGQNGDPAHDFLHILRVLNHAENLYLRTPDPKPNIKVLWAAVLFHDCYHIPKQDPRAPQAPAKSAELAFRKICQNEKLAREFSVRESQEVRSAIVNHSWSYGGNGPEISVIDRILQDADRLDNIGAFGIARTYSVGASVGRPFYDEQDPFCLERTPNREVSSLDMFPDRLLQVVSRLHFLYSKKLADRGVRYTEKFWTEFARELDVEEGHGARHSNAMKLMQEKHLGRIPRAPVRERRRK